MRLTNCILLLFLLLLTSGCVYPYYSELEGYDGMLVVEGHIVAGGISKIMISRSDGLDLDPFYRFYRRKSLNEMNVWLETEGGQDIKAEFINEMDDLNYRAYGYYKLDCPELKAGDRCRLMIGGSKAEPEYESDWITVLEAPVIDSLSLNVNKQTKQLELLADLHSPGEENAYYMVLSDEVWELHAQERAYYRYDAELDTILYQRFSDTYYCWRYSDSTFSSVGAAKNVSDGRIQGFKYRTINREDERLKEMFKSEVKAFRISEEAWLYWNNLDETTSGGADLFTPTPSNRRGNFHRHGMPSEHVIGYLSASEFSCDSIYYDNFEHRFFFSISHTSPISDLFTAVRRENWLKAWQSGYTPYQYGEEIWNWVPQWCVDCTSSKGSTKKRPEGWPNDHF